MSALIHGGTRRNAADSRSSIALAITAPITISIGWLTLAVLTSDAFAENAIRNVRDVRIEYAKPFGLAPFEDPGRNLADLEAAARELIAIAGPDGGGALESLGVRRIGDNVIAASAVAAPDGASAPQPLTATPLTLRSLGVTGAYTSVLRGFATQARAAMAKEGLAIETLEAIRAFADSLDATIATHSELAAIAVSLSSVDGVLHAPTADGGQSMILPAVGGFRGVDESAVDALETQIEAVLERELVVVGADGTRAELDYAVRALPAEASDAATLRFEVAFIGPLSQPSVPVSGFSLIYVDGRGQPIADPVSLGLPEPAAVLASTELSLSRIGSPAYVVDLGPSIGGDGRSAWAGAEPATMSLAPGSLPKDGRFSISALRAVAEAVLGTLQENDLMGVYVDVAGGQFDMTRGGIDTRGGATDVVLVAVPGIVDRVRVVASGERVDAANTIDPEGRRYERIKERSPFSPTSERAASRVLRQSELETYLHRLSRHPNRRVDAAVTPPPPATDGATAATGVTGTIGLDYLVTENKPWSLFVQGANTGTGATGEWQQRFGIFHSDLFGNDEILSIEYLTTDFDSMHAVNAYFDGPVMESEYLRWKVYGGWYEYNASDVGLSNERFEGSSPSAGAELSLNLFQHKELFVDAVVGARWFDVKVNNLAINLRGEQDFFVPYAGVRVQRNTRVATTDASFFFDIAAPDVTDVDVVELNSLGRLFPERDWRTFRWDIAHSFFLDPFFVDNPSEGTLAHELAFRFRGQYSFDDRLIPQQLGVAGGLYTVRGYPESIVAGDTLILATGEYRLHIPQILGFDANPQPFLGIGEPFRLRPQFGYGSTDWDLIFRAFVDVGRVENVDPLSFENDETLIGAGVGLQLQLWRNLDLRLDWGFPIEDLEGRDLDESRLSFVGTLAF